MEGDKIPHVESDESFEQSHRRVSEWRARTLSDAAEIHGGSRRQERRAVRRRPLFTKGIVFVQRLSRVWFKCD